MSIRRALLSTYDKTGLAPFAKELQRLGVELLASGGTALYLTEAGVDVEPLEQLTGFAEMLGHRVVTLHPAVHGGILARRDMPEDLADLERHGLAPIDLVCVNLYPFERTIGGLDVAWEEAIEKIDVGGPAMLRAAAKNHAHVVPICSPDDYEPVLAEIRESGTVSEAIRLRLAARAFSTTAAYDAAIAGWMGQREAFPGVLTPVFDLDRELSYGENPHQRAAFYSERGRRTHLLSRVEQRHGKELSFNNLNDLSAARLLGLELAAVPACVIVKHANPCGVAAAETIEDAYARALEADPVSAYGGVVVLTRPVTAALGEALGRQFVEVLFAPGYEDGALEALTRKPGIRILDDLERRAFVPTERDFKRVLGGMLVQDRDARPDERDTMEVVCGAVGDDAWSDLLFAWTVVKHVTSNAIVLARDGRTLGIGAGQMSRVDAVRIAVAKAREHGHDLGRAVMASDAFFPFADGPRLALEAGVTAVIQPGGSKRDDEVVASVGAAGAAMVVTGRRHFRH
jgi:phosphoribosylaminoimidazolecarboxamide formyltransferase / IMP cyclohydrolase